MGLDFALGDNLLVEGLDLYEIACWLVLAVESVLQFWNALLGILP